MKQGIIQTNNILDEIRIYLNQNQNAHLNQLGILILNLQETVQNLEHRVTELNALNDSQKNQITHMQNLIDQQKNQINDMRNIIDQQKNQITNMQRLIYQQKNKIEQLSSNREMKNHQKYTEYIYLYKKIKNSFKIIFP